VWSVDALTQPEDLISTGPLPPPRFLRRLAQCLQPLCSTSTPSSTLRTCAWMKVCLSLLNSLNESSTSLPLPRVYHPHHIQNYHEFGKLGVQSTGPPLKTRYLQLYSPEFLNFITSYDHPSSNLRRPSYKTLSSSVQVCSLCAPFTLLLLIE